MWFLDPPKHSNPFSIIVSATRRSRGIKIPLCLSAPIRKRPWTIQYTTATVQYAKISSICIPSHQAFSSSDASGKRLQWIDYMKKNHFKMLLKVFFLLLKNNLTNICSKISKIGMNLHEWFNLQYEKLWKVRKIGRRWMYFASLTEIMRDLWLY